jgi:hypothetical protein
LLIYPISLDHAPGRGIINKMQYQWDALSVLTGSVDLVCSSKQGPVLNGELAENYQITGRWFDSLNHYALFYEYLARLANAAKYDFLYIRYPLALPSFLWFLRRAKNANPRAKIIVEIATFPYRRELRAPKRRILLALDDLGHGWLKDYVDTIVTFYGQPEIFGVPCLQLQNGVDVTRIGPSNALPSCEHFTMISVSNLAERHGLDRVFCGLARYMNEPNSKPAILHVVGDGPARPGLTALSSQLGIDHAVRFHGVKSGSELDALFDEADLALDSLAIHRVNLPQSSSLKAREYCARGIPFVLASHDPDFPTGRSFVHHAPPDDTPLDISALVEFHANLLRDEPNFARQMRDYAEKHLTWKAKLAPLVTYLERELRGAGHEELHR